MTDGLNEHIGGLLANNPAEEGGLPEGATPEPTGDGGTFDGGDQLLEGPLDVQGSALPAEVDHGAPDSGETVTAPAPASAEIETLRTELDRVKNESAGRLNDLAGFREERRQFNENLEAMRQMFVEQQETTNEADRQLALQEELEGEAALYGEEVVNDPQTRYIRDIVAQNRQQMEEYQQQQEHYRQQVSNQREQFVQEQNYNRQMMDALKAQEDSFAAEHDDYYDAYKFAHGKRVEMWTRRGYPAAQAQQFVEQEEKQLLSEQLPRGGNVADQIYNLAKDWGWSPESRSTDQNQLESRAGSGNAVADIDRIKAGLSSQGSGQMRSAGGGGGTGAKEMTREEFFNTVPAHKRTQLFMDRPEVFEALGRHGRVVVDWD